MNPIVDPERAKRQARHLIRSEVTKRYASEMKEAGFFGSLAVQIKIELEIYRELKRRFPPGAVHLQKA